mmetsp:Transcript_69876/g.227432  ORF Transcript_69876/g.227432 Transcript_69876/m.227432 type:complete len:372 (+) Transcript_69876:956-2071(+)
MLRLLDALVDCVADTSHEANATDRDQDQGPRDRLLHHCSTAEQSGLLVYVVGQEVQHLRGPLDDDVGAAALFTQRIVALVLLALPNDQLVVDRRVHRRLHGDLQLLEVARASAFLDARVGALGLCAGVQVYESTALAKRPSILRFSVRAEVVLELIVLTVIERRVVRSRPRSDEALHARVIALVHGADAQVRQPVGEGIALPLNGNGSATTALALDHDLGRQLPQLRAHGATGQRARGGSDILEYGVQLGVAIVVGAECQAILIPIVKIGNLRDATLGEVALAWRVARLRHASGLLGLHAHVTLPDLAPSAILAEEIPGRTRLQARVRWPGRREEADFARQAIHHIEIEGRAKEVERCGRTAVAHVVADGV